MSRLLIVMVAGILAAGLFTSLHAADDKVDVAALGDLTKYKAFAEAAQKELKADNAKGALAELRKLEKAWDEAEADLKAKSAAAWEDIDKKMDKAIAAVRAKPLDAEKAKTAIETLLAAFGEKK
jgi:hypothetical protein